MRAADRDLLQALLPAHGYEVQRRETVERCARLVGRVPVPPHAALSWVYPAASQG